MFCSKCGAQQDDGARFCNKCGAELIISENNHIVQSMPSTKTTRYC
ncbi:MAG: zinc-ribbon domain-containing protein [Clostridiales bacterium]|nr:zinc-ribbon domain-containing protein [Clostridiales bacterium]